MGDRTKLWGRIYTSDGVLQTNISKGYLQDSGSSWGVWEMFRESIQNAWDEAQFISDTQGGSDLDYLKIFKKEVDNKPFVVIEDKGRGVDLEAILFLGESGKRGTKYRGQKGEGELISFLVAAQLGIAKWMISKDWAAKARFERVNGKYDILVLDVYRTKKPIKGTRWLYDNTNSEFSEYYDNLNDYFPGITQRARRRKITERKENDRASAKRAKRSNRPAPVKKTSAQTPIFSPRRGGTKLYVRDIFIKDINAVFSYNLSDVDLNRDRNMVDEWEIFQAINTIFGGSDITDKQMVRYWENAKKLDSDGSWLENLPLEYRSALTINYFHNRDRMVEAFKKVYGKNACLMTTVLAATDASTLGANIVVLRDSAQKTAELLNVQTDVEFMGFNEDGIKYLKKPTAKHLEGLEIVKRIGHLLGFSKDATVKLVESVMSVEYEKLGGWVKNEIIHLMAQEFDKTPARLVGLWLHEVAHLDTGYSDGSREFTEIFEELLLKTLLHGNEYTVLKVKTEFNDLVKLYEQESNEKIAA